MEMTKKFAKRDKILGLTGTKWNEVIGGCVFHYLEKTEYLKLNKLDIFEEWSGFDVVGELFEKFPDEFNVIVLIHDDDQMVKSLEFFSDQALDFFWDNEERIDATVEEVREETRGGSKVTLVCF